MPRKMNAIESLDHPAISADEAGIIAPPMLAADSVRPIAVPVQEEADLSPMYARIVGGEARDEEPRG